MWENRPDSDGHHEIQALNREFLRLLAAARPAWGNLVFGLPAELVLDLAARDSRSRDVMATTPCLLAHFDPWPGSAQLPRVAERPPDLIQQADSWWSDAQLFAAGLLTWLWQVARRDRLIAGFCVGTDRERLLAIRDLSPGLIRRAAESAPLTLRARLAGHPRFWHDLIRLADAEHSSRDIAARLSIVQLTVTEQWPEVRHR